MLMWRRIIVIAVFALIFAIDVGFVDGASKPSKPSSGVKKDKGSSSMTSSSSKSNAAIPRSKSKGGKSSKGSSKSASFGSTITRSLGGGLVYRMFREMKTAFGSELEALTLMLTRPFDSAIPEASIEDLIQCFEGEYENPQFTVSLLAKLSRKLVEPNVYTKLKSLLCLHRLMEASGDKSQIVLLQCIRSLRSEVDSKVGQPFFAAESVETSLDIASNVGEAEAGEIAREYINYVFDYIDCKGETPRKATREHATVDRMEILLSLIEQGLAIEDLCRGSKGVALLKQCSECCKRNRGWLLKQVVRLHELDACAGDAAIESEVEAVLAEFKMKHTKESKEAPLTAKQSSSSESERKAVPSAETISTPLAEVEGAAAEAVKKHVVSSSSSRGSMGAASNGIKSSKKSQSKQTKSSPVDDEEDDDEGDEEDENDEDEDEDEDDDEDEDEDENDKIEEKKDGGKSPAAAKSKGKGKKGKSKNSSKHL